MADILLSAREESLTVPCRTRLHHVVRHLTRLRRLTAGQDLIEYALLLALISTSVLIAVTQLGAKVPDMYSTTASALPGETPAAGDPPGGVDPRPGKGNPGKGNPGNDSPVGNPGSGNPGSGKKP